MFLYGLNLRNYSQLGIKRQVLVVVVKLKKDKEGGLTAYTPEGEDCSAWVGSTFRANSPPFCFMAVALSALEADLDACAQSILSAEERCRYQALTLMKRKREWLGGRLACKEAVSRLLGGVACLADIVVTNTEQGRPQVAGGDGRQVHVSISHSGDVAMALAAYVPCGLDVQEVTESLGRVKEKFILPDEDRVMAQFHAAEREQQGLVWAMKEALRKQVDLWPLLGFLETRLIHLEHDGDGFIGRCCPQPDARPLPRDLPLVYGIMYKKKALALCFGAGA